MILGFGGPWFREMAFRGGEVSCSCFGILYRKPYVRVIGIM